MLLDKHNELHVYIKYMTTLLNIETSKVILNDILVHEHSRQHNNIYTFATMCPYINLWNSEYVQICVNFLITTQ